MTQLICSQEAVLTRKESLSQKSVSIKDCDIFHFGDTLKSLVPKLNLCGVFGESRGTEGKCFTCFCAYIEKQNPPTRRGLLDKMQSQYDLQQV